MTTVVLVHGAWHGGWCWEPVVTGLAAAGHQAVAVDLPGHGADGGPLADLHGDAGRVRQALDAIDGPAVLVGHSYGGAVVTEAGDHPAVAHLVYVAAFNLAEGETCMAAATDDAADLDHSAVADLGALLVPSADGTSTTVDPSGATDVFFQDCDPAVAAHAVARLGPQAMASVGQSPSAIAWRTRPSTYVVCTDDNAIHPGLQAILARRANRQVSLPSGHSPFLSMPDRVVSLLAEIAAAC